MSSYAGLTKQENEAKYLLRDLYYADPSSASLIFWNGASDALEIFIETEHRVNWSLAANPTTSDPNGFRLCSSVRTPGKEPSFKKYTDCTEIEGLQILKFFYDDYKLGCKLTHRSPVPQDRAMLASIEAGIKEFKEFGGLPKIICTDKIILPEIDLAEQDNKGSDWIRDQYRQYFMTFLPDRWGRSEPFSIADREFLETNDELELPTQFIGYERTKPEGNYYDLIAIKPMASQHIGRYTIYSQLSHDINLLRMSYLDPALDQSTVKQLWTQNIRDWKASKTVQYAITLESMFAAANMLVSPPWLNPTAYTADASGLVRTRIYGN